MKNDEETGQSRLSQKTAIKTVAVVFEGLGATCR